MNAIQFNHQPKQFNPTKEITMSRISIPTPEHTAEASKPLLAAVQKSMGYSPAA